MWSRGTWPSPNQMILRFYDHLGYVTLYFLRNDIVHIITGKLLVHTPFMYIFSY